MPEVNFKCMDCDRIFVCCKLTGIRNGSKRESREFCLTDSFTAKCEQDHVILMERAWFGRMEMGRCVTRNFGHVGCFVDVIGQLDWMCSGRRSCEMSVSDQALVRTKPCPKDFTSYLDATYTCVKAFTPTMEKCRLVQNIIHSRSGHISSFSRKSSSSSAFMQNGDNISASLPHPSPHPVWNWVLRPHWNDDLISACVFHFALEWGKKLVLSLYDFSSAAKGNNNNNNNNPTNDKNLQSADESGGRAGNHSDCLIKMATVSEPAMFLVKRICAVCSPTSGDDIDCQWSRYRHVYTSLTNHVELKLYAEWPYKFLFHYERCSSLPSLKEMKVTVDTKGRLTAHCNTTGETFPLLCEENHWRGEVRNCTKDDAARSLIDTYKDILGLPNIGLSLAIVFGVAMMTVVYVATIMVCIAQVKRWRRKHRPLSISERRSVKNQLLGTQTNHHHHHPRNNNNQQRHSTDSSIIHNSVGLKLGKRNNPSRATNFVVYTTTSCDGKSRPSSNAVAVLEASSDERSKFSLLDEVCPRCTGIQPMAIEDEICVEGKPMTGLSIGRKKADPEPDDCYQSTYWSNDFLSDPLATDQLSFFSLPSCKMSFVGNKREVDKLNIADDFASGPDVTSQVFPSRDCSEASSNHRDHGYGSLLD